MNGSRRRGVRRLPVLAVVVLAAGVAATAAQAKDKGGLPLPVPVLGDPGQGSGGDNGGGADDQSAGVVVQVGPVTVDATAVVAGTPAADTASTLGQTVATTGSHAGGVVEIGGNNAASGSTGIVRTSGSKTRTGVQVHTPTGGTVGVTVSAPITGGTNRAGGSAAVARTAGAHGGGGSVAAGHANPPTAGATASIAPRAGIVLSARRDSGSGTTGAAPSAVEGNAAGIATTQGSLARAGGTSAAAHSTAGAANGDAAGTSQTGGDTAAASPLVSAAHAVVAAGGRAGEILRGELPFTGLALWFVLTAAAALLICGRVLR